MKHVCHLATHLRLGAGRYIVDLAIEQLRRGDSVSVCLSDDAEGNWKSDPAMVAELRNAVLPLASCVGMSSVPEASSYTL